MNNVETTLLTFKNFISYLIEMPPEVKISISGILCTTLVAIFSIRKTAEANRVSTIHAEMTTCLVETVFNLNKILTLLNDIGRKAFYNKVPEQEFIETAYTRYWREIGPLTENFESIQSKQRLVLPKKLCDDIQNIINEINEAHDLARYATPNENNVYPETKDLQEAVKKAIASYRNFVNRSRRYLGTEKLKPILVKCEDLLKATEETKTERKS